VIPTCWKNQYAMPRLCPPVNPSLALWEALLHVANRFFEFFHCCSMIHLICKSFESFNVGMGNYISIVAYILHALLKMKQASFEIFEELRLDRCSEWCDELRLP
jgi:hypothetical protein